MPRRSQEDRSRATRASLESVGRRLFAERGYSAVSAEEIVAAAGVTRGALHHHYGDKRGLFIAVLEQLEADNTEEIRHAIDTLPDPTDLLAAMATGLHTFLMISRRPETVRIAMSDGPAVLGWQGWREMEARHGLGLITNQLELAVESGLAPAVPVRTLAQLILAAITEAGMIVAHADDPDAAGAEAEQCILMMLGGLLTPPSTSPSL
ncbi:MULTISPECIES: TetR/AcrR family transcriptional regulator [Nocardia]|uniref:TetR/AcrR family transcriptional regulator n=2 Tax=Nocardia TaxID=1817 RepID=A0A2T2ZEN2_9NOCA|nr:MULTISPECIES: TetR/AcrR family transcriptional regulator [Nocardia]MBF6242513.1 TetR/AcrR family transcriptional regulator [Nocardia elegans]MBF6449731.1 TetR/AcrR family transcriptional regulator [Nocardia elegans]PSR66211.1 TetR/AcrR family transcriptional regulator [Nocardia nova]